MIFAIYHGNIQVLPQVTNQMDLNFPDQSIFIHATISSLYIFADHMPVTIHAVGDIGIQMRFQNKTQLARGIWAICVCFTGAYQLDANGQPILNFAQPPVGTALSQQQYAGEYLDMYAQKPNEILATVYGSGWYLAGQDTKIEWLSPNTTTPFILVTFAGINMTNGPHEDYAIRSFPLKSFPIQPHSDFGLEQTDQQAYVAGVIFAAFTVGEGILLVVGRREAKRRKIN